jgi:hypothetical protein
MTIPGPPPSPDLQPIPELLAGAKVVALVPATAELDRAAAMAWDFARSAANAGIRVALVDCYVDEPRLHGAAGQENDAGLVDIFEYGVSPARLAQPQAEPNLSFVSAGTYAPDRVATMSHPGWRRLAADLGREGATLLLFVAPECLSAIPVQLDGIVALAPGPDAGPARAPGIASAVTAGVPLIATLTGEEGAAAREEPAGELQSAGALPSAAPATDAAPATGTPPPAEAAAGPVWSQAKAAYADLVRRRDAERRKLRIRIAIYGPVLAAAAVAVLLIPGRPTPKPLPKLAEPVDLVPTPAPVPPAVPATATAPRAVEPLPFAVDLLSSTAKAVAMASGEGLEDAGFRAIVSPVRIGRRIWYRVYVGPVATRSGADSLVRALRAADLDGTRRAKAVSVPLSFALRRVADSAAARNQRARLRRAGIPSFVLGRADGAYELFAGAFATRTEAAYLGGLLRSAHSTGVLGARVGRR